MKCGIRCEIYDCTLELMELFGFDTSEVDYLKKLKEDRIRTQYYLKDISLRDENRVKRFVLKCKTVLSNLDSGKIEEVRARIKELMEQEE